MVNAPTAPSLATERIAAFAAKLYDEHADEAALLYLQRCSLLADRFAAGWKRFASLEKRLEAYIDALIIGGQPALDAWSARRAKNDDAGETYVGARLLAQRGDCERLRHLLSESADSETCVALAHALTADTTFDLEPLFNAGDEVWVRALLEIIAARRLDPRDFALRMLGSDAPDTIAAAARTIGVLHNRRATTALHHLLRHADAAVRSEAAIALAKLGDAYVVPMCMQSARDDDAPRICLALAGGPPAVSVLLGAIENGKGTESAMLGLGLLGDVRAVEPLFEYLDDPSLAEIAAVSLDALTGAALPGASDEDGALNDELFESETPTNTNPRRKPITVLSTNVEDWRVWWDGHRSQFNPSARYRAGKPITPNTLVGYATAETTPRLLRELTYDELAIRYGCDVRFRPSMSILEQQRALEVCARQLATSGQTFEPGRWYSPVK